MWAIDLSGSVALVIGGARGIGAACCRALAQAAAAVGIDYSGSERGRAAAEALLAETTSGGGRAALSPADVTDPQRVADMLRRLEHELGLPRLLVHSAGTTSRHTLEALDVDEWRRIVGARLTGAFIVAQHAAAAMRRHGGGAHYASSKAGLQGLVRHLSRELVPDHIRVNTVLPSTIDTELFRERYPDVAEREAVAAQIPARRLGTPEDIANTVVFVLSERASYIGGQSLLVDGGRTYAR